MPNIVKELIARNASCDQITGLLDIGSDYSNGHLSIYRSDSTRLTWHELDSTAFGTSVDGTATANLIQDAIVLVDGTASTFSFENRDGTAVWGGNVSVNGGAGALQLESISLTHDTTVAIASAFYIVPA